MERSLKYMKEQFLYLDRATVVEIVDIEEADSIVILDSTIFYPKGGGQPADVGIIFNDNATFKVHDVRIQDGLVKHFGHFMERKFVTGDSVEVKIEQDIRLLHSRIHTAGHLIDEAVLMLGYSHLVPTKGYHYPEGPSVEYMGNIEGDINLLSVNLEKKINELVKTNFIVKSFFANKEELVTYCHNIPEDLVEDKPIRVVIVFGDKGIPCGGTHVERLGEIGTVTIRKITAKKGIIKISYSL